MAKYYIDVRLEPYTEEFFDMENCFTYKEGKFLRLALQNLLQNWVHFKNIKQEGKADVLA